MLNQAKRIRLGEAIGNGIIRCYEQPASGSVSIADCRSKKLNDLIGPTNLSTTPRAVGDRKSDEERMIDTRQRYLMLASNEGERGQADATFYVSGPKGQIWKLVKSHDVLSSAEQVDPMSISRDVLMQMHVTLRVHHSDFRRARAGECSQSDMCEQELNTNVIEALTGFTDEDSAI